MLLHNYFSNKAQAAIFSNENGLANLLLSFFLHDVMLWLPWPDVTKLYLRAGKKLGIVLGISSNVIIVNRWTYLEQYGVIDAKK